jgi:hypothetical protein
MHPALVISTSAMVLKKLRHSCHAVVFLVLALVASQGTAFGSPQATGGGFQAAQNFAVGTSPQYVVVGDFNGDRQTGPSHCYLAVGFRRNRRCGCCRRIVLWNQTLVE